MILFILGNGMMEALQLFLFIELYRTYFCRMYKSSVESVNLMFFYFFGNFIKCYFFVFSFTL